VTRNERLIEREEQLRALGEVVAESSAGRVVLLSGEAGFGKTSILQVLINSLDHRYRVMVAACEPVGIPVAFGPLFDLLEEFPEELRNDIRSAARRPAVYAGMLDILKNDRIVLVLEDMHWADEATLGLVRYLGKRIEAGSTLIVTYRSEEVDLTHPLRLVMADLGSVAERIELPALTPSGVAELTRGLDLDPLKVHAATLGNPFFVGEITRSPELKLPPTIGNAVLASAGQLPHEAMELLYMLALSPEGLDLDLVTSSSPQAGAHLDLAVQRRLLASKGDLVTCRHDLIRESLLEEMPPAMGHMLHRRLLGFLEARATGAPDVAKLAYHSVGAGDAEKAVSFSLQAAGEASSSGAHRQAAFHYANVLEFSASMSDDTLGIALLEAAKEQCLVNEFDRASELAGRRIGVMNTKSDQARARAWFSYFLSRKNDLEACRREADLSIKVLESESASEELAVGLAVVAWVELVEGNREEAIRRGDEAVAVARAAGTPPVEVHAATTAGTARALLLDPYGPIQMEKAAEQGLNGNLGEFAARALNNLGLISLWRGQLEDARSGFDRLIEYCSAHELDAWYIAGIATRASINLASGDWDEVDDDLEIVLGQRTCVQTEVETLITAATLRSRRGDPVATEMIGDALDRIAGSTDHESLVAACALAMEGAWISVHPLGDAIERYRIVQGLPAWGNDSSGREILGFWARRLGFNRPDGHIPGPAGLEWDGRLQEAAESWEKRGFPVEAGITRAMLPDADLNSVFSELNRLNAEGVIRGLRRELQRRGLRGIPRGQRSATRQNPAGLTPRQADVLALMTSGLSNAAIAKELFITEKTASHHVSAILAKLNVSSRLQAAAVATANGWLCLAPRSSN
jgi:DNA-binding CsgD family transcriptional regulator/tetratricopeptide (TPR) repeat protein